MELPVLSALIETSQGPQKVMSRMLMFVNGPVRAKHFQKKIIIKEKNSLTFRACYHLLGMMLLWIDVPVISRLEIMSEA